MKMYDAEQIEKLISMEEVIEAIEAYFLQDKANHASTPERLGINDGENTALLMPSFFETYYGVKLVGVAPGNVKLNKPTLHGTYILSDRKTLEPLAVMDARTLTALRTGAISGLGMKYMAKDDAKVIGIIGTGDQGFSHLQAACAVRPVEKVLVANRSKARLETFLQRAEATFPQVEFISSTPEEMLPLADIIITTTTSNEAVIPSTAGVDLTAKHFAGSGSFKPFMQEISDEVIKQAKYLYVDTHTAFSESGELIKAEQLGHTKESVLEMEMMIKNGENPQIKKELTIFKSVGMAIFDIITAKLLYEK